MTIIENDVVERCSDRGSAEEEGFGYDFSRKKSAAPDLPFPIDGVWVVEQVRKPFPHLLRRLIPPHTVGTLPVGSSKRVQ